MIFLGVGLCVSLGLGVRVLKGSSVFFGRYVFSRFFEVLGSESL